MLDAVERLWRADPDLRLGQIIVGAANLSGRKIESPEVFSIEDDQLLRGILALSARKTSPIECEHTTIPISASEALVLFEFLSRFSDSSELKIEDQSEARVLWNICSLLEQRLSEPLRPDYRSLLERARASVRDASNA